MVVLADLIFTGPPPCSTMCSITVAYFSRAAGHRATFLQNLIEVEALVDLVAVEAARIQQVRGKGPHLNNSGRRID